MSYHLGTEFTPMHNRERVMSHILHTFEHTAFGGVGVVTHGHAYHESYVHGQKGQNLSLMPADQLATLYTTPYAWSCSNNMQAGIYSCMDQYQISVIQHV